MHNIPQQSSRVNMPKSRKDQAASLLAKANRLHKDSETEKQLTSSLDASINEAKQRVELYEVERVESWEELEEVAKRQRKGSLTVTSWPLQETISGMEIHLICLIQKTTREGGRTTKKKKGEGRRTKRTRRETTERGRKRASEATDKAVKEVDDAMRRAKECLGTLQEAMGQLEGALENLETRRQKFEEESSSK